MFKVNDCAAVTACMSGLVLREAIAYFVPVVGPNAKTLWTFMRVDIHVN